MAGDINMTGSLVIDDGSLDTDGYEVIVGGNVDINDELDAASGTDGTTTIRFDGNWDMTGGNVYIDRFYGYIYWNMDATLTSAGQSFNQFIVSDGLIGYWTLDEASEATCSGGGDACDTSGYGNDGEWLNGATAASTMAELNFENFGAATFDGVNDRIDAEPNDLLLGESSFTVSFWAATDAYTASRGAFSIHNNNALAQSLLIYPYDTVNGNGARMFFWFQSNH